MKRSFALTGFVFLILLAYGQDSRTFAPSFFWKSNAEKHQEILKGGGNAGWPGHLIYANEKKFPSGGIKSVHVNKQKLDSILYKQWSEWEEEWMLAFKDAYVYDAGGNPVRYLGYSRNESENRWEKSWKEEYSYDSEGKLTEYFEYQWNDPDSQWAGNWKEEYFYGPDGKRIKTLGYIFDGGWMIHQKEEYSYDGSGKLVQYNLLKKDFYSGDWENERKEVYSYNGGGWLTDVISSDWDAYEEAWLASRKETYNRNAAGKVTEYLASVREDTGEDWLPDWKDEYAYDENGDLFQDTGYERDVLNNRWVPFWRNEYAYNQSFTAFDLVLPGMDDVASHFNHMLMEFVRSEWDSGNEQWKDFLKGVFHYSEMNATPVAAFPEGAIVLYPNPANAIVHLRNTGLPEKGMLKIFDMLGRVLLSKEISGNETVDLRRLGKGIYNYLIVVNGKKQCGKLIKQ